MDDRFRFRVWIKSYKILTDVVSVDYETETISAHVSAGDVCDFDFSDVERMQCTGLKDKNGRLIFEGDICKDSLGWVFAVEWDNDNSRFIGKHSKPRGDTYVCYVGREPIAVETIGNIYDNPKLLEGRVE